MTAAARVDLVTADAGARVRRAHARELAAVVVQHLHRLVKLGQMHAIDNQAVRRAIDAATESLQAYQLRAGESVTLFFARGVVFFGGEPLKAARSVYDAALEIGGWVERAGGSELAFAPDVTTADLRGYATAMIGVLRGRAFGDYELPRVRIRQVSDAAVLRGHDVERLPPEQRIVRTYASAVVILRRFFEELAAGRYELPHRIKRVAQSLVDLSAGQTPAFLGVTAVRNANHDEAGRAVNSAILAVAMGRQVTSDPLVLTRIAMASMLHDVGRPRALRALSLDTDDGGGLGMTLGADAELTLPAGTAAVLTALGRVNEPSIVRTVVAYEAQWLLNGARLGPVYRGLRPPTLHARIVAVARAYNALLTPTPGEPIRTPTDALLELEEETAARAANSGKLAPDSVERTVLRLLMGALGVLPPGTLVELSSGEIAVVVEVGSGPPVVRIVLDASGGMPDHATQVALGADDARAIVKVLGTDPTFTARGAPAPVSMTPPPSAISGVRSAPRTESVMTPHPRTAAPRTESVMTPHPRSKPLEEPVSQSPSAPGYGPRPGGKSSHAKPPPRRAPAPAAASEEDRTVVQRSPFSEADDDEDDAPTPAPRALPATAPSVPPVSEPTPPPRSAPARRPPEPKKPPPVPQRAPAPPAEPPEPRRSPAITGVPVTTRSTPETRTADVRGSMQRSPLPHLLVHILGRAMSGTLVLNEPGRSGDRDHVVTFRAGAPEKQRLGSAAERLGDILVAQGVERAAVEAAASRATAARRPIGKQLVIDGAVRPAEILEALRAQHQQRLAALAELSTDATYEFFTGHDLLPDAEAVVLDPLATVMAAMRLWEDARFVEAPLTRIAERPLVLHPAAALARFQLTEEESTALEWALTGKLSLSALLADDIADPPVVRRMIYGLLITKHLDFGGDNFPLGVPREHGGPVTSAAPPEEEERQSFPPPSGAYVVPVAASTEVPIILRNDYEALPQSHTPISAPRDVVILEKDLVEDAPPSRPPDSAPPDSRRTALLAFAADLANKNHYQVLGIERGASLAEIQAGFLAAAKRYHPDKLPAELADLRESAAKAFSAVADAHKTLVDGAKRSAYDQQLDSGKRPRDESTEVERVLGASTNFQKAEVMLRRNDPEAAERLAQLAAEADPTQAEYLALHGWLISMRAEKDSLEKAREMLDRALAIDADSDRALYYRGAILKRLGKMDAAIKDFRKAAEENPKNLDATREVRLYEMRVASGRLGKSEKEGFLGSLFKKKK